MKFNVQFTSNVLLRPQWRGNDKLQTLSERWFEIMNWITVKNELDLHTADIITNYLLKSINTIAYNRKISYYWN